MKWKRELLQQVLFERQKEEKNKANELIKLCSYFGLNSKLFSGISENFLFFDKAKKSEIEKELNVNLSEFFATSGKTYFFAESNIGLLMFYHNHHQSYGFEKVVEEKRKEFLEQEIPIYHPATSLYLEYWREQKRRCIEGYWQSGYWMPPKLFFMLILPQLRRSEMIMIRHKYLINLCYEI